MTDLDALDIRLLELIQLDSALPQSELGNRIHLSTAAVNRRLKRLVDNGVVRKVAAVLEPAALGHPLTIVTQVETQSEQIELLDAMKRSFRACPQVQQCYYVTGEWDFILIFVVRDMAQYTALSRALFFESNNVKRFRTLVTMDHVKVSLDVPLD
ncbi:Lrp/AsnC family transcriptional regulator [Variovorax sp. RA8]|uniref:Lrp/AsnC family transcriptional regulator n=1 Tax=Variovorax sp. (strain JCM 16519 / RA8) TaxID=662548 RepID=UPI00131850F7|nr:Lrp/AsnC family transcriptional regulator [Variovorax sp. RA8]VTU15579.1 Leucine-responsive regulatory protein [Variovorax sp. RA8]